VDEIADFVQKLAQFYKNNSNNGSYFISGNQLRW
jgi:hypothetical protein